MSIANKFVLMKTSWKRLLKTKTKDVIKTSSSRRMFAGLVLWKFPAFTYSELSFSFSLPVFTTIFFVLLKLYLYFILFSTSIFPHFLIPFPTSSGPPATDWHYCFYLPVFIINFFWHIIYFGCCCKTHCVSKYWVLFNFPCNRNL